MVRQHQSTPWLHRYSRIALGAIAILGAALTAYLTVIEATGGEAACPTNGCNIVLASPYAQLFGLPLPLFGCLGYLSMAVFAWSPLGFNEQNNKDLRLWLEDTTWTLLFIGGCVMTVFSAYLMYLLAFEIQAFCPYCITSAVLSVSLLGVSLGGRYWDDIGQIAFIGVLVVFATLVGVVGIYSTVNRAESAPTETAAGVAPPPIQNSSGPSEIALAKHLQSIGAVTYSAYWCPHCQQQREMFGRKAFESIAVVECAAGGQDAQPEICRAAGIEGYPTWEIDGQKYAGAIPLSQLAEISGYTGSTNFIHSQ
ncbi:MAG: vitamin K epoxide reductase family protein [Elainellaceae cyanobacterium]